MILYFPLLLGNNNKIKYMCISIRAVLIFILTNAPFFIHVESQIREISAGRGMGKTYEMEELKQKGLDRQHF
jgi:hypothetical protein